MRVLLFGTGTWLSTALNVLLTKGSTVAGVVLNPGSTEKEIEDLAGYSRPIFRPLSPSQPDFLARIRQMEPDIGIVLGYKRILPASLLALPHLGFINIHPGKLPDYRGRNVLSWAILNDERDVTLTAHRMDEGIDTGPVLSEWAIPITWQIHCSDLIDTITKLLPAFFSELLEALQSGSIRVAHQQQPAFLRYFTDLSLRDRILDWNNTSSLLYRQIRAFSFENHWALTCYENSPIYIVRAHYETTWPSYVSSVGSVVAHDANGGVYVKTGDSVILVTRIRHIGGDETSPLWRVGEQLGPHLHESVLGLQPRLAAIQTHVATERESATNDGGAITSSNCRLRME